MTNNCKDPVVEVTKEGLKYLEKNESQAKKLISALSKAIINISAGLKYSLPLAGIVAVIYIINKFF